MLHSIKNITLWSFEGVSLIQSMWMLSICQEYINLSNLYVCRSDCLRAVRADVTSFHNAHREHVRAYLYMHECVLARTRVHFYRGTRSALFIRRARQAQGSLFSIEDFSSMCRPALSRSKLPLYTLSKLTLAYTCSSCLYEEAVIAGLTRKLGLPAVDKNQSGSHSLQKRHLCLFTQSN
jgi:hypothetical protein